MSAIPLYPGTQWEIVPRHFYMFLGNPQMSTFANSEDPDEMQHNAAFHQGLHCFYFGKTDLQTKNRITFFKLQPDNRAG